MKNAWKITEFVFPTGLKKTASVAIKHLLYLSYYAEFSPRLTRKYVGVRATLHII